MLEEDEKSRCLKVKNIQIQKILNKILAEPHQRKTEAIRIRLLVTILFLMSVPERYYLHLFPELLPAAC